MDAHKAVAQKGFNEALFVDSKRASAGAKRARRALKKKATKRGNVLAFLYAKLEVGGAE